MKIKNEKQNALMIWVTPVIGKNIPRTTTQDDRKENIFKKIGKAQSKSGQ